MKIVEIENEKVKIKKIAMLTDSKIPDSVAPFPSNYGFYIIVSGGPGSGKSSLIYSQILEKGGQWNRKFNKVHIWSPSLSTLGKEIDLPPEQIHTEFDTEEMKEIIESFKDTGMHGLFIIDDFVGELSKKDKIMLSLIYNRRHKSGAGGSVSIIITTQQYNRIPASLRRGVTNGVFIFSTHNKKELNIIEDELFQLSKPDFQKLIKYCFKTKHDQLYINLDDYAIYKNFNLLNIEEST
jgi:hypothetical protein